MPEDKLSRDERIRLEALSQSLGFGNLPQNQQIAEASVENPPYLTEELILSRAERIEAWLKAANRMTN